MAVFIYLISFVIYLNSVLLGKQERGSGSSELRREKDREGSNDSSETLERAFIEGDTSHALTHFQAWKEGIHESLKTFCQPLGKIWFSLAKEGWERISLLFGLRSKSSCQSFFLSNLHCY